MFASIVVPLLGVIFISLSLINLSPNINISLHYFLHDHLQQIHETLPSKYLRDSSFNSLKRIFSIYLLICGFAILTCNGLRRLMFLIPLSIISIYIVQLTIIYGLNLANIPIYMFLLICLMIILFNDCARFDEMEIK